MPKFVHFKYKSPLFYLISLVTFWVINSSVSAAEQTLSSELKLAQAQYREVEEERVLDALVEAVHKATVSAQDIDRFGQITY